MTDPKSTVTLKRTVTLHAIVTEDFKKYMVIELSERLKRLQNDIQEMDSQLAGLDETIKQKGEDANQAKIFQEKISFQRQRHIAEIQGLQNHIEEIKNLSLGTLYTQGTVDGLVNIKEGDNLFQKLSAMEIITKDGIVTEIKSVSDRFK